MSDSKSPQSIEMSKVGTDRVIDQDLNKLIDDIGAIDNTTITTTADDAKNANILHVQFPAPDDANDAMNEAGDLAPIVIDVDDSVLYSSDDDSDSDDCIFINSDITAHDRFVQFYRSNKMAIRVVTVAVVGTIAVAVVAPRIVRR